MDMSIFVRYDIIGINMYRDRSPVYENGRYIERKLNYARADAEAMAGMLERSQVLCVDRSHAHLHTDAHATSEAVRRSLSRLFAPGQNLPSHSIALFYFAGHGLVDPIGGIHILLGCHDVDMKNPKNGGISLNEIYDWLQGSSATCSIAIIDACFSGGIDDPVRTVTNTPLDLANKAFGALYGQGDKSYVIFASCQANQQARESEEFQHGVFTQELLTGWRDGAAVQGGQEVVYINSLVGYLSQRFREHRQKPVLINHRDQPIPLAKCGAVSLSSTAGTHMASVPSRSTLMEIGQTPGIQQDPQRRPARSLNEQLKGQIKPLGIVATILVLCGLAIWVIPALHTPFLALVFALTIVAIPLGMVLKKASCAGMLLGVFLLLLLPGYSYSSFGWGKGVSFLDPVFSFMASLEWIFWLVLFLEIIVLAFAALDRS
jgi:hypothetical protein